MLIFQPLCVPRPGIEPGWIAPLVFETSASTDSAIWAYYYENECCLVVPLGLEPRTP